jgi:G:T-mismatch repair DNA endonuclease (very short patch repair protein)
MQRKKERRKVSSRLRTDAKGIQVLENCGSLAFVVWEASTERAFDVIRHTLRRADGNIIVAGGPERILPRS